MQMKLWFPRHTFIILTLSFKNGKSLDIVELTNHEIKIQVWFLMFISTKHKLYEILDIDKDFFTENSIPETAMIF